jgi:uncharacterized membrane-anchored protein YhcB (DUF1043 family)
MFDLQLASIISLIGVIIGVILHWLKVIYERRDIIEWSVKYWMKAYEDQKVTVDEVFEYIKELIDKLGLGDKIIIKKAGEG